MSTARLFDERPASDTTDTCTLSARPTLDTSSDRAKATARMVLLFFDDDDDDDTRMSGHSVYYWRIKGDERERRTNTHNGLAKSN